LIQLLDYHHFVELISEDAILEWIETQEELVKFMSSTLIQETDPLASYATGYVNMYSNEHMKAFVEWIRSEEDDDDDDDEGDDGDDGDEEEDE
jgi:hypothetical protein